MPRKMCTVQVTHGVHVTGQILYLFNLTDLNKEIKLEIS